MPDTEILKKPETAKQEREQPDQELDQNETAAIIEAAKQDIGKIHDVFSAETTSFSQGTEDAQLKKFKISFEEINQKAGQLKAETVAKLERMAMDPRQILAEHEIKNPADNLAIARKLYETVKALNFEQLIDNRVISRKERDNLVRGFTSAHSVLANPEVVSTLEKIAGFAQASKEKQKFIDFFDAVKQLKKETSDASEVGIRQAA